MGGTPRRLTMALLGAVLLAVPVVSTIYSSGSAAKLPVADRSVGHGRVVAVSDGDSITVLSGGRKQRVRLMGIDCPEHEQPFGAEAKQFTARLVLKKEIELIPHGTDRYQRLVAEVLFESERSLNQELVQAGLAWWYRRHAPNNLRLKRAEKNARAARRGLWAETPTAPWDFRARAREERQEN